MGFVRIFFIGTAFTIAAVSLGVIPTYLPPPGENHIVQPIPKLQLPGKLEGVYASNDALHSITRLFEEKIPGSESLAVSPSGKRLFLADKFGWVHAADIFETGGNLTVRLDPASPFVQVIGRPLGIHAVNETSILICDSFAGLLSVDLQSKRIVTIARRTTKRRRGTRRSPKIVFANDLDIGPDGVIYFSDSADIPVVKGKAGFYSTFRTFQLMAAEGRPSGRMLAHNPAENTTLELLGRLWGANGVAVSKGGEFVAVVETFGFRVHRYWLKGRKAKERDVLIENLPGFPDGISRAPDGNFWIAVLAPPVFFWSQFQARIVRLVYAWLTHYFPTPWRSWGYVIKVSPEGDIVQVLNDVDGSHIQSISSVLERNGRLFLGNLMGNYVSVFNLQERNQKSEEGWSGPEQSVSKEEL